MMNETESGKIDCEVEGCEKKENGSESSGGSEKAEKNEKGEERKQNTPACNCDRALATEKIIMGLPY